MTTLDRAPDLHLTREDRSALTHRLLIEAQRASDPDEREELLDRAVVANIRIARAVAMRYRGRGVPVEDLEQAACEGLTKAVRRFDPALRHDLLSYAVPTIRGEVQRYFRDLSWNVRPPRRVQDLQWRINQAVAELTGELGREPAHGEISERVGVERSDYDEAVMAFGCFQPPSLDQPVDGSESLPLGAAIPDEHDARPAVEARAMLAPLVGQLSARDQRLIYLRFIENQTQRQIGEEFGVPQMQVSRWLSGIYRTLRERLEQATPQPA